MYFDQCRYGRQYSYKQQHDAYDIWNEVALVPQLTGMSCWAAAAAMLVGWRDRTVVNAADVAAGIGHWRAYQEGLQPHDIVALANHWGLVIIQPIEWTVSNLYRLLKSYGPLWIGEASPGLHSIVLTGLYGDGSEERTMVRINDPWPVGKGERYQLPFRQLVKNYIAASNTVGAAAHLLHSGGRAGADKYFRYHRDQSIKLVTSDDDESISLFSSGLALEDTLKPGSRYIDSRAFRNNPLVSHAGSGSNIYICWNEIPLQVDAVDVVVHFHGYSAMPPNQSMLEDKVAISGLQLNGRPRPTIGIVMRGQKVSKHYLTQHQGVSSKRYTFPGVLKHNGRGLSNLIAESLYWFSSKILKRSDTKILKKKRLIFTAHSGGGAALNHLLHFHNKNNDCFPHEAHFFDALYGGPELQTYGIVSWVRRRILKDSAANSKAVHFDMADNGGRLVIIYGRNTTRASKKVEGIINAEDLLGGRAAFLKPYYRVEFTSKSHNDVPRLYGPKILKNI